MHIIKVLYGNVWRDKHPSLLEYGISKQVPKFHKIVQEKKEKHLWLNNFRNVQLKIIQNVPLSQLKIIQNVS